MDGGYDGLRAFARMAMERAAQARAGDLGDFFRNRDGAERSPEPPRPVGEEALSALRRGRGGPSR